MVANLSQGPSHGPEHDKRHAITLPLHGERGVNHWLVSHVNILSKSAAHLDVPDSAVARKPQHCKGLFGTSPVLAARLGQRLAPVVLRYFARLLF